MGSLEIREEERDIALFRAFIGTTRDQRHAIRAALLEYYGARVGDPIIRGEEQLRLIFRGLLEPRTLNCCPNGHMAFTGVYEAAETCLHCEQPQFRDGSPTRTWQYIPLIPRLAIQFNSANRSRQLTTYREGFPSPDGVIKDVFDGAWFRACCRSGYSKDARTLALRITLDGVGLVKNSRLHQQVTPVMIYLLNLHPTLRDTNLNALCSLVIPGGYIEEKMDTWLEPLMSELRTLCDGVSGVWDGATASPFTLQAHPIMVTGDGPAIAGIMGTKHPGNAQKACRLCPFQGTRFGRRYYYPHNGHTDHATYGNSRPFFEAIDQDVGLMGSVRFRERQTELGVNRRSALIDIPTLHFPRSFPIDTMHCVSNNIPKHLMKLWKGHIFADQSLPWVVPKLGWTAVDNGLMASRGHVPTHIATAPRSRLTYKTWTSSEYRAFFLTYGAPMMKEVLPTRYESTLLRYRLIMQAVGKTEFTYDELSQLQTLCQHFVSSFEADYCDGIPARAKVCTIQLHYLLHLARNVRDFGSPVYFAQWGLERAIRRIKGMAVSTSQKYQSISIHLLAAERFNHYAWARGLPTPPPMEDNQLIHQLTVRTTVLEQPWLSRLAEAELRPARNRIRETQSLRTHPSEMLVYKACILPSGVTIHCDGELPTRGLDARRRSYVAYEHQREDGQKELRIGTAFHFLRAPYNDDEWSGLFPWNGVDGACGDGDLPAPRRCQNVRTRSNEGRHYLWLPVDRILTMVGVAYVYSTASEAITGPESYIVDKDSITEMKFGDNALAAYMGSSTWLVRALPVFHAPWEAFIGR